MLTVEIRQITFTDTLHALATAACRHAEGNHGSIATRIYDIAWAINTIGIDLKNDPEIAHILNSPLPLPASRVPVLPKTEPIEDAEPIEPIEDAEDIEPIKEKISNTPIQKTTGHISAQQNAIVGWIAAQPSPIKALHLAHQFGYTYQHALRLLKKLVAAGHIIQIEGYPILFSAISHPTSPTTASSANKTALATAT
jgi:hypothetical protein